MLSLLLKPIIIRIKTTAAPATKTDLQIFANQIITTLGDELDSKLTAQRNSIVTELKAHTEEVVAAHSTEILEVIASVVEPLERRVTILEAKAA